MEKLAHRIECFQSSSFGIPELIAKSLGGDVLLSHGCDGLSSPQGHNRAQRKVKCLVHHRECVQSGSCRILNLVADTHSVVAYSGNRDCAALNTLHCHDCVQHSLKCPSR